MAEDKLKYLEELRDKLEKSNIREFKNWKEVCELFSWKITRGTYKEAREKELSQICNWTKEGHRIIINKINDSIDKTIILDNRGKSEGSRGNNRVKPTQDYKVPSDKNDNIGVYIIIDKDNNCYIGSTINGFRNRYRQHKKGVDEKMKHTYDLLNNNNAEFKILYDMTGIKDIELIRMVEDEYIQYYKSLSNYNVINKNNYAYAKNGYHKQKYKSLKIKEEDYMLVIKLLQDNNIEIKGELLDYE